MRSLSDIQKQTLKLIDQSEKILCVTTPQDRGDGAMAALAAQQWLSQLGKTAKAVFPGSMPGNFDFLAGLENLNSEFSREGNLVISVTDSPDTDKLNYHMDEDGKLKIILPVNQENVSLVQEKEKYDLILCFGVDSLDELGDMYRKRIDFFQETPLINIGVSPENDCFAKINLVDRTGSSVCGVLYDLMVAHDSKISADLATILLTGIITSNDSFLSENTTASAFAIASQLQEAGAEQSAIIENLYKKKSLKTLKLWGQVFARLEFDTFHRICRSTLQKTDFEMLDATPEQIENLTRDILRFVSESDVFVLFYEFEGVIGVQLRTSEPTFDWAQIAGEHPYKMAEGGINMEFSDVYLADTEKMVFAALVDYQNKNRGLDADTAPRFLRCGPEKLIDQSSPVQAIPVVAEAPANIPFEAPMQPHESTGQMPETDAKKDWIKKNFPAN